MIITALHSTCMDDDPPTTVAPTRPAPEATPHAWSLVETNDLTEDYDRWLRNQTTEPAAYRRPHWQWAVGVVFFAVVAWAITTITLNITHQHTGSNTAPPTVEIPVPAPPAVTVTVTQPTPPPAAPIQTVPPANPNDPAWKQSTDTDPVLARQVCDYMAQSTTHHAGSAAQDVVMVATNWDWDRAFNFAAKSIVQKCPQYTSQ